MSNPKAAAGVAGAVAFLLVGLAILGLGGAAVYELRAARIESAALAALRRQNTDDQKQLQKLEKEAQAIASQIAQSKKSREAAKSQLATDAASSSAAANGGPSSAAARRAAARANAQAFLAQFPQAGGMLLGFMTRNMQNYYAPFFRSAGLSQAQIDDFIGQTAQLHLDTLELNPDGSFKIGQNNLSAAVAQSILGEAGYQQWQDAIQALPGQYWAMGLAITVKNGAPPLSSEQVSELTQVLAVNSPDYASGNRVNLQTVDWASAMQQAQGLMTEAQWQQTQNYLTLQAANRQLQSLMKGAQ